MGDVSEYRGLITAITFLGVLGILISLIPYNFLVVESSDREINVPEYFEALDLQYFAESINFTISNQTQKYKFYLGGHAFYFWTEEYIDETDAGYIGFQHIDEWWIFWTAHNQKFYNSTTGLLESSPHNFWPDLYEYVTVDAVEIRDLDDDDTTNYIVKCDHVQMFAFIDFNHTAYETATEAWNNGELYIVLSMEFDQVNTSFNAWNIIGMLVFFELPNIHPIINLLLRIPLWVAIAYISFILILRAIGAIFGGGA